MTNQPTWKCKANLGYVSPWDYGGAFVMVDTTGVYCPELWVFEVPDSDDDPIVESRILLERCTYIGGILSDNKHHPSLRVWFGTPDRLAALEEDSGVSELQLINSFCSEDIALRAAAYKIAVDHHGLFEFDQYPIQHTDRKEVKAKMRRWINEAHLKG